MDIAMIGINYRLASIEEREHFALTPSRTAALDEIMVDRYKADGCVALSTCNRTEVWCSGMTVSQLKRAYQQESQSGSDEMNRLFICKSGVEAVRYLFELGCGLHSQILGEDQILAQIKNAAGMARERHCLDSVLETLFRFAVTVGKRVKSTVLLSGKDLSIPQKTVELAENLHGPLKGKCCLVIGNGEMGRLTCTLLVKSGAEVMMTLRQYKQKDAIVPKGCKVIPYEERYTFLKKADFLFSATLSPHFTLEAEPMREVLLSKRLYCFDLALPRDLDPALRELPQISLYDLDDLGIEPECDPVKRRQVDHLLSESVEEFIRWYYFRDFVPAVKEVSQTAAKLTAARLEKPFKVLNEDQKLFLQNKTEEAAYKSFAKVLYGLRDHLDREHWAACLDAVRAVVEEWQDEEGAE